MRIARWETAGETWEGFVVDDTVVPFPGGLTVADVLARGLDHTRNLFEQVDPASATRIEDVRLLAPVVPTSIRDFVAFEEHVEGMTADAEGVGHVPPEWYEAPTFYFTNPHTVLGPDDVLQPPVTQRLDFELELAIVVGAAPGVGESNLSAADSASVIFGYTIMNDWSARDLQMREMAVRLGPAKGKDFGTALGPWIVTADELAPRLDDEGFLAIHAEVYVNGSRIGEDMISNAGWPFPEFVAYASRSSRVVPGDVLGSGTVGNGGCLGELWGRSGTVTPPPLIEGDQVRMIVEGIGDLVGTVGAPASVPDPAVARVRPRNRR
ncbi:fumarylacetoacetate hydrolase family protein [Microbacterium sp.]|uniref:fumarylacetoacetate hydrolase family protein n=1 Tax=Microbacterium sp. TaxID=51671 RepID=UPI00092B1C8C|nr:fumarylacetoacetate hydrolase family protein [Microbacterium sp.]MBN9189570.1 fumarylacetoacetate hydrolase family protein [Microbacterium sp.]MBN9193889.1 fumarylacetoacetate hydrolase family protein [Microbacterium sp.]OJU70110.1 MAG: hydroxylase [Microbacterium sp. 70-38]